MIETSQRHTANAGRPSPAPMARRATSALALRGARGRIQARRLWNRRVAPARRQRRKDRRHAEPHVASRPFRRSRATIPVHRPCLRHDRSRADREGRTARERRSGASERRGAGRSGGGGGLRQAIIDCRVMSAARCAMPIGSLKLTNVGPFDDVEFEFDQQVNVFTGPNNSGKSTVLWALGDILVQNFGFPLKLLKKDPASFQIRQMNGSHLELKGQLPVLLGDDSGYWNPEQTKQYLHFIESVGYAEFIPSLRLNTDFRSPGPTARNGL